MGKRRYYASCLPLRSSASTGPPKSVRRKFTNAVHSISASNCSGHRLLKSNGSSILKTRSAPGGTVTVERPSEKVSTEVMQSIHAFILRP